MASQNSCRLSCLKTTKKLTKSHFIDFLLFVFFELSLFHVTLFEISSEWDIILQLKAEKLISVYKYSLYQTKLAKRCVHKMLNIHKK